jgi:hypothetical protein
MRRRHSQLPSLLGVVAALAASTLSCGREMTGPPDGGRTSGPLSFTPLFPAALRASNGGLRHVVAFERVRVVFRRSDGGISLDRTIGFPSDADSVSVSLSVPVSAGAPESGEVLALSLYYVDAANDTVFTGGPVQLTVRGAKPGEPPAEPVPVTLTYTGPGRDAVRVALSPVAVALTAGQTQTFTTQAFDALDNPLQAPVLFESTDTSIATVSDAGLATARSRRGSAFVIAKLYGGAADTSPVSVALPAARITASSGSGQSGPAGSLLAQNVIVLVTAADSVPVAGVPVTFAATGGGSPGSTVVNTDASGFASTTWTLGATVGAQTMTAAAAGLTGSPVTFTATATPGVPTALAFTVQPPTAVAGQAMTPSVVVEARTSAGGLATGFTDSVTVSLGANPGSDSLFGTMTVAAVGGIATFSNLALDRAATGYSLVASSGTLTSATSAGFNVVAANANYLGFEVQPAGGTPGVGMLPAPTVRAYDIFGNPAAYSGNVTVAIGANPGGATLGGTITATAVAGLATFPGLTISAGGVGYTLVATGTGVFPGTSSPFTVGTATIAWANPSGGNWSTPANWNLNRVPEPSDIVDISIAGTFTVTLDVSPTVAGLEIGTGATGTKTLQVSNRTLTLNGDIIVGPNGALNAANSTIAGVGTLNNDGTLLLLSGTLALSLDNRATTIASGGSVLNGGVSNAPGATLRVAQFDGCCSTAVLTINSGVTNEGTIELSNQTTNAYGAQLNVVGTLVNAVGATIASLGGQTPGGARSLAADLENQGTMTVAVPLTLIGSGATHQNSGTIDVSADLTVQQSGTSPSFTTTGIITIAAGRTLSVLGGAFTKSTGSLGGPGTLALTGVVASFVTNFSNETTGLALTNSTINGPGILTVASGRTLSLFSSTIAAPFVNVGTTIATGASAITGTFSNAGGATLRVAQLDGCCSTATLTVSSGFTNAGTIELSNQTTNAYGAQLNVVGTLVNAVGGTIASLGGQTPGGVRGLAADLDNRGTLLVAVPLTLSGAGATHENSGTIDVSADLLIQQSGASPSFTSTGTVTVGAGRTLSVTGGAVTPSGTWDGAGTVSFSGTAVTLDADFANDLTSLALVNSTVNGAATFTNGAGRTLALYASAINTPIVNAGTLLASAATQLSGTVTTVAGSTIRVGQLDGATSLAHLTVANGFTNLGTIELTTSFAVAYAAELTVTNGTLVNGPSGTISALPGAAAGGARTLSVQLDNQGTLSVLTPLTLARASADHLNSGAIDVASGDLTITQTATTPSFVNSGTITIGAGRTLGVSSGTFTSTAAASISGGTFATNATTLAFQGPTPAVATMTLVNSPTAFAEPVSTAATTFNLSATTTISGPGPFTNAAGRTLTLNGVNISMPFVNEGTLYVSAASQLAGTLTTTAASVIRIGQVDGVTSLAHLTVADGFTNLGTIELTTAFAVAYDAQLTVATGTLLNAAGGTIVSSNGLVGGGTRTIVASGGVDNQGTITVGPGTAGRLAITGSLVTSGVLNLELGGTVANTGYDVLAVSGSANFGGTLTVSLINAFTPASAQTFAIITRASGTGTFAFTPPAGIQPTPTYNATDLTLVGQ